jgi:hypothetical protein
LHTDVISRGQLKRLQEHGFESLNALFDHIDQETRIGAKPKGTLLPPENGLGLVI